jgi:hypothetical protein
MAALAQHAKCQTEYLPPGLMEGKSQAEAYGSSQGGRFRRGWHFDRAQPKRALLS